ncbi:hypothetical protein FXV77_09640 [Sphingobacterium phlebotomi]|uniref:Uncharacterized protein n=1 Tax=Sphingobacterium phlebotomi TaxID=2605433 RepID=A0A5D4H7B2_9SPHI|nr:hypothetical protein [Sphingobacterium phlebotomi]TYR36172.1 hypothetical protein FXV77_09640 [Sphingobacterium phlebotomi]
MKKPVFLLYAFVIALLFNLKVWDADIVARLKSHNLIPLLLITIAGFWAYAIWIGRQYGRLLRKQHNIGLETQAISLSYRHQLGYILWAIVPVVTVHMAFIWCVASIVPHTLTVVFAYMRDYLPVFVLLVGAYTGLLLFRPEYALKNSFPQKVVEIKEVLPADIDERAGLYTLFQHLIKQKGLGPVFDYTDGFSVRFFDIAAIKTHSKEYYVYLTDGDKLRADDILKELKARGLDRWMIKISKYYCINMLLVAYPIEKPRSHVELTRTIYSRMVQKIPAEELDKMCKIGPAKKGVVEDFLADNDGMTYEGWDSFIPLR